MPILKKNLDNLNMHEKYEIINQNIFSNINFPIKKKFDLIFMDPPYKEKNITDIIENLSSKKLLKDNGVIIIHRHKKENEYFSENFKIFEIKKYGISKVIFGTFI